jgi:hypothetical protein
MKQFTCSRCGANYVYEGNAAACCLAPRALDLRDVFFLYWQFAGERKNSREAFAYAALRWKAASGVIVGRNGYTYTLKADHLDANSTRRFFAGMLK